MHSCVDSYHASILMDRALSILSSESDNDIEPIIHRLQLMGANSITPCMECAPCHDFIFYSNTLQKVLNGDISKEALQRELQMWRKIQLRDEALANMQRELNKNDFNKVPIEPSGTKIYLDQNVLSSCAKNGEMKKKLNDLRSKNGVTFFYSPSNLEEIHKIPNQEEKSLITETLSELTENTVILPGEDKNLFFKEAPIFGLRRIEKFHGSTEALEKLRLASSKDREIYLKKYNTEEHKRRIANNDDIFNSLTEDEFQELVSFSFSSLDNKESFKEINSGATAAHAIYTLSNMLDLLGYKIENKERTQKSSLHDIEHLIYGLNSDLFVTDDHRLQSRAMQIYKFMKSTVKVVNSESLLKMVFEKKSDEDR